MTRTAGFVLMILSRTLEMFWPLVKSKFAFFQMQEKGCLADTSELGKASFRVALKTIYAIDMATLIGKFVVSLIDPEMLLIPSPRGPVPNFYAAGLFVDWRKNRPA